MSTNADLIRQFNNYELIDMDSDDDRKHQKNSRSTTKSDKKRSREEKGSYDDEKKEKKYRQKKSSKTKDAASSDEDGKEYEKIKAKLSTSHKGPRHRQHGNNKEGESTTETDIKQLEMDQDVADRNAFVNRMLERDEIKTKKLEQQLASLGAWKDASKTLGTDDIENLEGLTTAQIHELATKGTLRSKEKGQNDETNEFIEEQDNNNHQHNQEEKILMFNRLRELSRQQYLEKREQKELQLLDEAHERNFLLVYYCLD